MPLRMPPAQQPKIMDLLEPFGYAMIDWDVGGLRGLLRIDMILITDEPLMTTADVRAWAHDCATEALNCLEASGYEIRESTITLKGKPVECTMRIEAVEPG